MKKVILGSLIICSMVGTFTATTAANDYICEASEITEKKEEMDAYEGLINEANKNKKEQVEKAEKNKNEDKEKKGWKIEGEKKYYILSSGEKAKGWNKIDGETYYFELATGNMKRGFLNKNSKIYYLDNEGVMQKGFQNINGKKYYFSNTGQASIGLKNISGKEYYFNEQGIAQTGAHVINGKRYYFNENGERSLQQEILAEARTHIGKRYVYGATGPNSFDCSGLTQYVYKQFGVNLNRTTYTQVKQGKYVAREDLQIGDLIFSHGPASAPGHVGIYSGNGNYVHAANSREGIIESKIYSYTTARRIVE